MTVRLYYDDSYMTSFTATVLETEKSELGYIVTLDKSAFYPTSGGQPHDTGTIGNAAILDVYVDKTGEVRHLVDSEIITGATVNCKIDWKRRWDHMQQHAGEHMIAGAAWKKLGGNTIGLHLGSEFSTIDVELPDGRTRVPKEDIDWIEDTVNGWIEQDLPIKCYFPTPEEMSLEPLRKPPSVKEHIRLVKMGDVECVACGGTHPSSTGQVGLVKIIDSRPSRGKLRLSFVCGMRAFLDYRKTFDKANEAAQKLSSSVEMLPEAVDKALERIHELEREVKNEKTKLVADKLKSLIGDARTLENGLKVVSGVLHNADQEALLDAARLVTGEMGLYALLASDEGDGASILFAGPEKCAVDMGQVLSKSVKPLGGKGGGRGDMARGAGPGKACIEAGEQVLGSLDTK